MHDGVGALEALENLAELGELYGEERRRGSELGARSTLTTS